MLACYRRKSQFEVLNYLEYIAWSASAYWNIILFSCNNNFAIYLTFLISEKTINSYIYWRISYRFIQSEGIIWFTSAKVWNSPYGKRGFSQSHIGLFTSWQPLSPDFCPGEVNDPFPHTIEDWVSEESDHLVVELLGHTVGLVVVQEGGEIQFAGDFFRFLPS